MKVHNHTVAVSNYANSTTSAVASIQSTSTNTTTAQFVVTTNPSAIIEVTDSGTAATTTYIPGTYTNWSNATNTINGNSAAESAIAQVFEEELVAIAQATVTNVEDFSTSSPTTGQPSTSSSAVSQTLNFSGSIPPQVSASLPPVEPKSVQFDFGNEDASQNETTLSELRLNSSIPTLESSLDLLMLTPSNHATGSRSVGYSPTFIPSAPPTPFLVTNVSPITAVSTAVRGQSLTSSGVSFSTIISGGSNSNGASTSSITTSANVRLGGVIYSALGYDPSPPRIPPVHAVNTSVRGSNGSSMAPVAFTGKSSPLILVQNSWDKWLGILGVGLACLWAGL